MCNIFHITFSTLHSVTVKSNNYQLQLLIKAESFPRKENFQICTSAPAENTMIYLTCTGNLFFRSGVENSAMAQIINNTTNTFFNLLITIKEEQANNDEKQKSSNGTMQQQCVPSLMGIL